MPRSKLYLVAMPIGDHIDDLSIAGLRVLQKTKHLFLEADDELPGRLREHKVLADHHRLTFMSDMPAALAEAERLIAAGETFALLASSGMPCFVDPGHQIVLHVLERAGDTVELVPLGMSSALDAALTLCGTDIQQFIFAGHYPEAYLLDRSAIEQQLPLLMYVRGSAVRAFVRDTLALAPQCWRLWLFKDIRKRSRSSIRLVQGVLPDDLIDDPQADYVAVVLLNERNVSRRPS